MTQDRTEIEPYEGINTGQRNAGCQAMDNVSKVMVKIKPEDGEPAAAEHDVSGEHKEESRCPPAAASRGESLPPRYSKVQITAEDGEPAAGPTAAERFVAGEYEEGFRWRGGVPTAADCCFQGGGSYRRLETTQKYDS